MLRGSRVRNRSQPFAPFGISARCGNKAAVLGKAQNVRFVYLLISLFIAKKGYIYIYIVIMFVLQACLLAGAVCLFVCLLFDCLLVVC